MPPLYQGRTSDGRVRASETKAKSLVRQAIEPTISALAWRSGEEVGAEEANEVSR